MGDMHYSEEDMDIINNGEEGKEYIENYNELIQQKENDKVDNSKEEKEEEEENYIENNEEHVEEVEKQDNINESG